MERRRYNGAIDRIRKSAVIPIPQLRKSGYMKRIQEAAFYLSSDFLRTDLWSIQLCPASLHILSIYLSIETSLLNLYEAYILSLAALGYIFLRVGCPAEASI